MKSDMDMLSDDCDELRDELEACRLDSDRKQEDLQGRIDDLLKSQPNPCIEVALGAEIHSSLEAENSVLKDMVSSHQAVVSNYIRRETEFRAKIKEVSDLRECETNELQYRLDQQAQVIADKDALLLAASDRAIDDNAKIHNLLTTIDKLNEKSQNLGMKLSRCENFAAQNSVGKKAFQALEEFFDRGGM